MTGERYRLVEIRPDHGGEEHVHSVVLNYEEAQESLDAERILHELAGWSVTMGDDMIVCSRGAAERIVQIRKFNAMSDSQTFEKGESGEEK